jgi:glycosyltransferase involved in cell wall biosynthesis
MRKKICIVSTIGRPILVFLRPHIEMLTREYDVTLLANACEADFSDLIGPHVRFIPFGIVRKISIMRDLAALIKLYLILRRENFELIHSVMPKSGLVAMVAGFLARVPCRIHTFTGQVWATKKGPERWLLRALDKVLVWCSTGLLADSFSQKDFLINEGVVKKGKITVLGNGSICGVDLSIFNSNFFTRCEIRSMLEIPEKAFVYLFLGRLTKDKGVLDLAVAFARVSEKVPNTYLVMVGPDEDSLDLQLSHILLQCKDKFRRVNYTNHPEKYMCMADIFCLPSYREGFGSTIIESAACGVPAIASRIYGLTDAVESGVTGLLHPAGDVDALAACMLRMFHDDECRTVLAKQAYERSRNYFSKEIVVREMESYYRRNFANFKLHVNS